MSDDNSTLSDVDDSESASSAGVANEPCRFTRANDAAERLMGDKQREWDTVAKKQGNLHLLDLPHDILSCIVAQVASCLPSLSTDGSLLLRFTI